MTFFSRRLFPNVKSARNKSWRHSPEKYNGIRWNSQRPFQAKCKEVMTVYLFLRLLCMKRQKKFLRGLINHCRSFRPIFTLKLIFLVTLKLVLVTPICPSNFKSSLIPISYLYTLLFSLKKLKLSSNLYDVMTISRFENVLYLFWLKIANSLVAGKKNNSCCFRFV